MASLSWSDRQRMAQNATMAPRVATNPMRVAVDHRPLLLLGVLLGSGILLYSQLARATFALELLGAPMLLGVAAVIATAMSTIMLSLRYGVTRSPSEAPMVVVFLATMVLLIASLVMVPTFASRNVDPGVLQKFGAELTRLIASFLLMFAVRAEVRGSRWKGTARGFSSLGILLTGSAILALTFLKIPSIPAFSFIINPLELLSGAFTAIAICIAFTTKNNEESDFIIMILTLATLCLMGEGYIALADEQAMLIRIVGQAMIVTGSAVPAVYLMMRMFQSYRYAELYRSKERDARIAVNANSEITPIVFREIAVQLREPLAITDTTGRVLFANDKLIEMSGLAKKQILGGLPSLWQHVSTAPDFYRKAFDAMRGNKETFEGVVHNSYPNDRRRSYDALVRITPVLDEVGDIACCVLQQRNLTADQERTELLRHVINTMPIGVLLLDARTMDITLISTQAEYMLGRAELNLRATKNFSDIAAKFLQSDGTPYDTSSLPPYLATKDRRTHEVKNLIIGEGQKRMTWTMAATPFTGGDGSITDILVAIDDVSRNQTFEHSMTDFVSVASHQLRTPLTGIKWSLDALRKADVKMSDEDKRLLFETCYEASDRMMITIQQLLQVAEFERGGKALKPEPVSIETSIKGNVASLKALIDRKKLTFKESVLSALPPLMTDPFFVSQLTMNIIENAVKYTPDGGEIDSILRLKDGAIEWTLHDTGIGIPKSSLPKIFEKFFRADNAQKLVPDGTGLGLTIVRSIVDMLGGSIRIESEEGRGTTVEVRLPLKGKE